MTTITLPTTAADPVVGRDAEPPRAPLVIRRVATPADTAAWARYVATAPGATLFHHPDWCETVTAIFGHRPFHFLATRGDRPVGVLPLIEVNSLFGGRLLISVPYGTYGGMLADDAEVVRLLQRAAVQLTEERHARVLDLRSETAQAAGFEAVTGYLGFARDLPDTPEAVGPFLPKRARAAARHARDRDGMTVRHGVDQLPLVWQLYCRSMRRIASINYPFRFFTELQRRLGERFWVSVTWAGSAPACGTISFVHGNTIMPYVLGADERIRGDGATNLLYWSIMEQAVAAGVRHFDYGRSRADNAGAAGFKKNQGFEPRPLGYQRYVPPGGRAPDLKPSNPRFALARRVWARLPLAVTQGLGAWLSRSLPG